MAGKDSSSAFLKKCKSIKAKRPRTVIEHILKHGYITTEELKETYGYNHPPRAARDVREHGIPLETFKVKGSDGRHIAAYKFGEPSKMRRLHGRSVFSKVLKQKLLKKQKSKCGIYLEVFPENELQVDHRVPFEVSGDIGSDKMSVKNFMLLSPSANRAKSWSCEHCVNWRELKKPEICGTCYWAFPETYEHVAMRQIRRLDMMWQGAEVKNYEAIQAKAIRAKKDLPDYVKDVLKRL
jgi:hypothetical protein